jgi:hypothetical protein
MRGIGQSPMHGCSFEHETPMDWTSTHTRYSLRASGFRLASQVGSGESIADVEAKIHKERIPPDDLRRQAAGGRAHEVRPHRPAGVDRPHRPAGVDAAAEVGRHVSKSTSFLPMPMTTLALLVLAVLAPPAMGQPAALTDTSIKMADRRLEHRGAIGNMANLFIAMAGFNADISRWNVANVRNMHSVFYGAKAFNSELAGWNVAV